MRVVTRVAVLMLLLVGATACASIQERVMQPDDLIDEAYFGPQDIRPPLSVEIVHQENLAFVFSDPVLGFENTTYDYSQAVAPALMKGLSGSFDLVSPGPGTDHLKIYVNDIRGDIHCRKVTFYECSQKTTYGAHVSIYRSGELKGSGQLEQSSRATGYDYFLPVSAFDPLHMEVASIGFSRLIAEIADFADVALGIERK